MLPLLFSLGARDPLDFRAVLTRGAREPECLRAVCFVLVRLTWFPACATVSRDGDTSPGSLMSIAECDESRLEL